MNMKNRDRNDPLLGSVDQRPSHTLGDAIATNDAKVVALGDVIYQVRNNLVHGSKAHSGDDLTIVSNAIKPLKALLTASIQKTQIMLV